ncbi:LPXTG cell wall anchor domain-containing protein [Corynebacterium hylobatis]|uniref:LPXTG cell wall anchor domain-containing protein n=1 Tax=Corynebacterium hylobatis TaxID=1859290 RepID=A0A430I0Q0_9CORY|nr:choice-of-anchor G family protein [Corynebacterium hylobatis]RSZ64740.1 LPXTG cell wall anchor domain-containing protein [Corynebacterium hylobatis]
MKKKLRRPLATALSVFLMAGVVLPVETNAQESTYDPITHLDDAYAYSYGGLLDLRLLHEFLTIGQNGRALSAAELRGVDQLWETAIHNDQTATTSTIDLQALELIYLNLGAISLPLVGEGGLLELVLNDASVGVLREYAHTPSATAAHGAAGVVSDSGGLEITQPGSGKNASINLLSLLDLQGSNLIPESIISAAALELGAVSAVATKPNSSEPPVSCDANLTSFDYNRLGTADLAGDLTVLAEEDGRICSGYQIADAQVVVDAPVVGTLVTTLQGTLNILLGGVDNTLNGVLGSTGLIASLRNLPLLGPVLGLLGKVEANVSLPTTDITQALLADPLEDSTGLVSIDLSTGEVLVDLKQLHGGNLSGLDPNTSLLTAQELSQITDTVTNLLTAGKEDEPNGLNARLDRILRGENKQGGLYATAVDIEICALICTGLTTVTLKTTLGGLLNPAVQRATSEAQYQAAPYDYYYREGVIAGLTAPLIVTLLGGVGAIIEGLLFAEGTGLLGGLLGDLQTQVVSPLLSTLNPVLTQVLAPLANVIINRQTLEEVNHGAVFTVSALEVNVLDLNTSGEVIHLPLGTASVMAQHWDLIDLNVDVAKIGNGRDLHTGGYTYDMVCEADRWPGLAETGLVYGEDEVGDGFLFDPTTGLALAGAAGGLAEPIQVAPGAVCTVVADPEQEGLGHQDALRPTGDTPTRTPYTYFLDTVDNAVVVSGETLGDDPTVMSPESVDSSDDRVEVDAESVGDEWKNHSFTFVVPEDAEFYSVNIVHVYDIDTRDVVVTKTVAGEAFEDRDFSFQYSLDGGESWTPEPGTTISHEGTFTIEDVPVLDEHLEDTSVLIRETLGTDEAGPVVSWALDEDELTTGGYGGGYATASFVAGPVSTLTTPDQTLNVTNSYAAIEVDKHIDGPLDGIGKTTLLPSGEDSMTIHYTVKNIGAVELDTIKIYDPSLNNSLFTLPAGVTVDPSSGEVSGCTLTFDANGEATCSLEVSFANPEASFHYEADAAEVTAEATVIIDGREITATANDKHGAMRLSDLIGMLPATGVTTLVGVLALGLIAALGALALYVRSRRK